MRIQINGNVVNLPTTLREISLQQKIDFYNQYGRRFDESVQAIQEMPDGIEKELEATHLQFEKMFAAFAFFTGTEVEALKESEFVGQIANIYFASIAVLFAEEEATELQSEFYWNDAVWYLHPPELTQGSDMRFGEFIDAKQMIKNMADLGAGKWEALLPLCAIYLRKKDEAYDPSFLYEGSERLELMRQLPMDIALQVAFFLTNLVHSYLRTFPFSGPAEAPKVASSASSTSKNSAGSISSKTSQKRRYSTSPAAG